MRSYLLILGLSLVTTTACSEIRPTGVTDNEKLELDRAVHKVDFAVPGKLEITRGERDLLLVSGDEVIGKVLSNFGV